LEDLGDVCVGAFGIAVCFVCAIAVVRPQSLPDLRLATLNQSLHTKEMIGQRAAIAKGAKGMFPNKDETYCKQC
jgi:hypothetical protein